MNLDGFFNSVSVVSGCSSVWCQERTNILQGNENLNPRVVENMLSGFIWLSSLHCKCLSYRYSLEETPQKRRATTIYRLYRSTTTFYLPSKITSTNTIINQSVCLMLLNFQCHESSLMPFVGSGYKDLLLHAHLWYLGGNIAWQVEEAIPLYDIKIYII